MKAMSELEVRQLAERLYIRAMADAADGVTSGDCVQCEQSIIALTAAEAFANEVYERTLDCPLLNEGES